jgi:hypothetical protein
MLIRLLTDAGGGDGKPTPPVEDIADLDANEVSRLLVTCSTEVILHMVALIAGFDPAKARAIWLGLSSDAVRRLEVLCRRSAKPSSMTKPSSSSPTTVVTH